MKLLNPYRKALDLLMSQDSLRRSFVAGSIWALMGAILARSMTLLASISAGRILGAEGFGSFGIVQSTMSLFGALAGAGLGLTATKFIAQYRDHDQSRVSEIVVTSLQIALVASLGVSLIFVAITPWLATQILNAPNLVSELRVGVFLVLFGAINGVQVGAVVGFGEFRSMAAMQSLRGALLLAFVSVGAYFGELTGAILGYVLAEALSALVNQVLLRSVCSRRSIALDFLGINTMLVGSLGRFALPVFLSSIVIQPAIWGSNVLLVNQPSGFESLGIYMAADKWRQLLLFFPVSLSAIVLPFLSNLDGRNDNSGYVGVLRTNLMASLLAVLVPAAVFLFMPSVFMAIYGIEYESGSLVLQILSLSALFAVLNNVLGQVLVSKGRIWPRFWLDFAMALLLFGLSWILVPRDGMYGLATANLLSLVITVSILIAVTSRMLRAQSSVSQPVSPST